MKLASKDLFSVIRVYLGTGEKLIICFSLNQFKDRTVQHVRPYNYNILNSSHIVSLYFSFKNIYERSLSHPRPGIKVLARGRSNKRFIGVRLLI